MNILEIIDKKRLKSYLGKIDNEKFNEDVLVNSIETFVKILAPLAPHFSEELWEKLGHSTSVHKEAWPKVNEQEMLGGTKEFPVQVNGKLKTCVTVNVDSTPDEILAVIKENEKVKEIFNNYNVKKEIYVPRKNL